MHSHIAHTKLQPCPFCPKAASDVKNQQSLTVMLDTFDVALLMDKADATSTCAIILALAASFSAQQVQLNQLKSQTATSHSKQCIDGSLTTPCLLVTCQSFAITNNLKPKMSSSIVDSSVDSCTLTLQSSLTLPQTIHLQYFTTPSTLLVQKTHHSLMSTNMPFMHRLLPSKQCSTKSSMTHCEQCLPSSKE